MQPLSPHPGVGKQRAKTCGLYPLKEKGARYLRDNLAASRPVKWGCPDSPGEPRCWPGPEDRWGRQGSRSRWDARRPPSLRASHRRHRPRHPDGSPAARQGPLSHPDGNPLKLREENSGVTITAAACCPPAAPAAGFSPAAHPLGAAAGDASRATPHPPAAPRLRCGGDPRTVPSLPSSSRRRPQPRALTWAPEAATPVAP